MNKRKVQEVVDIGLSSYEFTEQHRQYLLKKLKSEKSARKRMSVCPIAIVLIVIVVIALAVILLNAFFKR